MEEYTKAFRRVRFTHQSALFFPSAIVRMTHPTLAILKVTIQRNQ